MSLLAKTLGPRLRGDNDSGRARVRQDASVATPTARPSRRATCASARLSSSRLRTSSVNAIRASMLLGQRVDRGDVDLLAREDLRDVAQQALAIHRLDDDVDREHLVARRAPVRRRSAAPAARARMRARLRSDARWIVTPLPRVTKPTIGSGGAGLQQRARPVISRSTPTTRMPPPAPAAGSCASATSGFGSRCGAARRRLRASAWIAVCDLARLISSRATAAKKSSSFAKPALAATRVEVQRRRARRARARARRSRVPGRASPRAAAP